VSPVGLSRQVVRWADRALQEAKSAGKNQWRVHEEPVRPAGR
jgi:hypothetical protein